MRIFPVMLLVPLLLLSSWAGAEGLRSDANIIDPKARPPIDQLQDAFHAAQNNDMDAVRLLMLGKARLSKA